MQTNDEEEEKKKYIDLVFFSLFSSSRTLLLGSG